MNAESPRADVGLNRAASTDASLTIDDVDWPFARRLADALVNAMCKADTEWDKARAYEVRSHMRTALASVGVTGHPMTAEHPEPHFSSGKHIKIQLRPGSLDVCDTCVNVLGLNVRWDHALRRGDHPLTAEQASDETTEGLTEAESDWFREDCAVCLGSGCRKCEAVRDEIDRILADRLAAVQADLGEEEGARRAAQRLHSAQRARAESAEAERDDLRARLLAVEALIPLYESHATVSVFGKTYRNIAADLRAVLASPSTQEWPDCATYPTLGCVCRGGLQPSKGTCTRKRTGDLTPLASPSTHTQRDTETAAQAWDDGWQTGQLWAFSDLDEHAKNTNPYRADSHATEEGQP